MDDAVRELARDAGIANEWVDAADKPQRVSIETLRSILTALDLPCVTQVDIAESRARLREQAGGTRGFFTATEGSVTPLAGVREAARIATSAVRARTVGGGEIASPTVV